MRREQHHDFENLTNYCGNRLEYISLELGQGLPTARNPILQVLGIGLD